MAWNTPCSPLKSRDPVAYGLCLDRLQAGDRLQNMDVGADRLEYRSAPSQPLRVWVDSPQNGRISPQEIYNRYLDLIDKAETSRSTHENGTRTNTLYRDLQRFRKRTQDQIPFIFGEFEARSNPKERLFQQSLAEIRRLRESLRKRGILEGNSGWNLEMAKGLFAFIRAEVEQGGLGIRYSDNAKRRVFPIGEIYSRREATCLEFCFLFYALGRLAGIPLFPVEVFRDKRGVLIHHARMGLETIPGKPDSVVFFDMADGSAGKAAEDIWQRLSRLDMLALFYDAMVTTVPFRKMDLYYRKALRYSPENYLTNRNYGHWLVDKGKWSEAEQKFLDSIRGNAFYPFSYLGLMTVYRERGNLQGLRWAAEQYRRHSAAGGN